MPYKNHPWLPEKGKFGEWLFFLLLMVGLIALLVYGLQWLGVIEVYEGEF